jgi:predicted metal-dependent HD superfamily phosphohydrolase
MIPPDIVQRTAEHVQQIFQAADNKRLYFHSFEHTQEVAQHAMEIGQSEHVSEEELNILQIAAWFHDVGHLNGEIQDHETRSVTAAKRFLTENGVSDEAFIQRVSDAIMATRMPHVPNDKLGEIMCDADVYHFGTEDFRKKNKLIKKELKARAYPAMVTDWPQRTLKLLQSQHFFSPSVRNRLEEGKAENVRWLRKKIAEKYGAEAAQHVDVPAVSPEAVPAILPEPAKPVDDKGNKKTKDKEQAALTKEAAQAEKAEKGLVARGMQTMLRLGSSNHLDLSRMADGKANILISVNSIIISVILSIIVGRLDADPHLLIPTILFLTSSVITVVLAILATRPKLTEGTFTRENIHKKETNLLFFGNFYKSSLEEYTWAMNEVMQDKDYLYDTLVKDIYYLGIVLGRKYKLLRIAYNVFMIGLIVAVISFSVAIILNIPSGRTTVINANGAPL